MIAKNEKRSNARFFQKMHKNGRRKKGTRLFGACPKDFINLLRLTFGKAVNSYQAVKD
jgi:hypothetical protein